LRAEAGGAANSYTLQAAIAACHARANTAAETDWERIVLLYDALLQVSPSPIVGVNRAVSRRNARKGRPLGSMPWMLSADLRWPTIICCRASGVICL